MVTRLRQVRAFLPRNLTTPGLPDARAAVAKFYSTAERPLTLEACFFPLNLRLDVSRM
jgi:hypothetical protein